jgi:hypothetical protein
MKRKHTKFILSLLLVAVLLSVVFVLVLITGPRSGTSDIPEAPSFTDPLSKSNTETIYRILPSSEVISGTISQVSESTISVIQEDGTVFDYVVPENFILNCIATRSTINIKSLLLDRTDPSETSASLYGDVPSHEIPYLRQEVKKDVLAKTNFLQDSGEGRRMIIDRNVISVTGLSLNKLFDLVTVYLDDPRGCREN